MPRKPARRRKPKKSVKNIFLDVIRRAFKNLENMMIAEGPLLPSAEQDLLTATSACLTLAFGVAHEIKLKRKVAKYDRRKEKQRKLQAKKQKAKELRARESEVRKVAAQQALEKRFPESDDFA